MTTVGLSGRPIYYAATAVMNRHDIRFMKNTKKDYEMEQEGRQTPSAERVLPLDKAKAKGISQAADQEQTALGVLPGDACTRSLHLL